MAKKEGGQRSRPEPIPEIHPTTKTVKTMSNDPNQEPEGLPDVLRRIFTQKQEEAQKRNAHLEEFSLQIEQVAQTLRQRIYATTDQPGGPSEAAAVSAMRSWEKTCLAIKKGLKQVVPDHREAWVTAIVEGMKVIAVMDRCQCESCAKERGDA